MVNNVAAAENPAVEQAVRNAIRVFRATLAESMHDGLFGTVAVQFHFQNGKLQLIKAQHERNYQVRD